MHSAKKKGRASLQKPALVTVIGVRATAEGKPLGHLFSLLPNRLVITLQ